MLYIIGLGLGDENDITLRGLQAVKECQKIYLEYYTSLLGVDPTKLSDLYDREITIADRDSVELEADEILKHAKDGNSAAFLVVGDPLCATTHTDLILRAKEQNINVQVIHNASVMGAVASCGLQLYNYGQTISIPFFTANWKPDSFYDKIKYNRNGGMHTLCLLDIKVKEPDYEALSLGKKRTLPPRFMTVNQAIEQLLYIEEQRNERAYTSDSLCVGLARLGRSDQKIVAGTLGQLQSIDFGAPLHSLIIAGDVHVVEKEMLAQYYI
ncbi:hypothetical protein ABG067_005303 [Albugo candida]